MKLSKKKSSQLYAIVHDDIMKARIKINIAMGEQFTDVKTTCLIDNILSSLCYTAPQKAIDIFNLPNSKQES
jgi:hypothetical protein